MRNKYSDSFKAKIALEAISGDKTLAEMSSEHGIHVNMIQKWKKEAIDKLPFIFQTKKTKTATVEGKDLDELLKIIGQQKIEIEWMKKKVL
jgi:transposase-like protein